MAFQKMRQNIHYIGADGSPFLPQNAAELAAMKITMAEERRKVIAIKVERLTEELSKKGKLRAKTVITGHFLFLRNDSCFHSENGRDGAIWPTVIQLKEEGDRRVEGTRRRLPPLDKIYRTNLRKASHQLPFGLQPVDGSAAEETEGNEKLESSELPNWLRELIGG